MIEVLLILCTISMMVFAFLGGFFIGSRETKNIPSCSKPLSFEERNRLLKEKKEYENFLNYDGTPQE